jgi:hypothetical protein
MPSQASANGIALMAVAVGDLTDGHLLSFELADIQAVLLVKQK